MIFIHTYGIGKFRETVIRSVHNSAESAEAAKAVLGGEVIAYLSENEVAVQKFHAAQMAGSELNDIIDHFSEMEPEFEGSESWDLKKMQSINLIVKIIEGEE